MSEYVISRQFREVFLVYKCSTCHNPVLLHRVFSGMVKVTSSVFNTVTPEAAGNQVLDMLEENINNTCHNKRPLRDSIHIVPENLQKTGSIEVSSSWGSLNWPVSSSAQGRAWLVMSENTCCPICGSTPLWMQDPPLLQEIKKLHKDCFPKIYHSIELANLYAHLMLQKKYEKIINARLVPGTVEKAQQDMLQKAYYKQTLERQAPQDINQQLNFLTEEVNALNSQLKLLKAFDFKAKKSITQQIAEKQQEINTRKSNWEDEALRYKQELLQTELALQDLAYMANGPTLTAKIVYASDALAYKLIPNSASEPPLPTHSF